MTFTILYLFSGRHRDTSFAVQMKELGRSRGVTVSVEEVDIEFGASFDLSVQEIRQHYLSKTQRRDYDAVVCTPPCSTYSRVRMANMRGPPPLRSREFPFGFPWLSNKHKKEAELGTMMADYTLEVAEMVATVKVSKKGLVIRFFSEHPEDLGAVIREEDKWRLVPASGVERDLATNAGFHSSFQPVLLGGELSEAYPSGQQCLEDSWLGQQSMAIF